MCSVSPLLRRARGSRWDQTEPLLHGQSVCEGGGGAAGARTALWGLTGSHRVHREAEKHKVHGLMSKNQNKTAPRDLSTRAGAHPPSDKRPALRLGRLRPGEAPSPPVPTAAPPTVTGICSPPGVLEGHVFSPET